MRNERTLFRAIGLAAITAIVAFAVASCETDVPTEYVPQPQHTYHEVTFNTGGGSPVEPVRVRDGQPLAMPTNPTRGYYIFAGWYTNAGHTTRFTPATPITGPITLFARWAVCECDDCDDTDCECGYCTGARCGCEESKEGLVFTRGGDGYSVTGFIGTATYVVIPSVHNGLAVVAIGNRAFYDNQLTSVTIPGSVTSIGDSAFASNRLTSVAIPDGVTSIGDWAFASNRLTSVAIPDSVTHLSGFSGNRLTSVAIPDGVISIGSWAFSQTELTSVAIPDSVTSIGEMAFAGNELTSVTIPDGVTSIGASAFSWNQLTSVTIPNSVTSILFSAFANNELTSVTIPGDVTSIGAWAFGDNVLTSITIPGDVQIVHDYSMGTHGASFLALYESNGRLAGRYEFVDGAWTGPLCAYPDDNGVVRIEVARVDGGYFRMGDCPGGQTVTPIRTVTVSGFYMGVFPVTQGEWYDVMGTNPSWFHGGNAAIVEAGANWRNLPVEQVSWFDAVAFANALSVQAGLEPAYTINGTAVTWNHGANGYRLPTEAEWEFVARGGIFCQEGFIFSGSDTVADVAWHGENSGWRTHEVGQLIPNALGLYDMSGNVWEMVWDRHGAYPSFPETDPTGSDFGSDRMIRGGDWSFPSERARSVYRSFTYPAEQVGTVGFRIVRL